MADYLEAYAARFELPVRTGVAVDRLAKSDGRFVVSAGAGASRPTNVIVATGAHQIRAIPDFASELDPRIVQLHSSEYRNPSQLQEGDVLVVGAGNSGAEIAVELAARIAACWPGPKRRRDPCPARPRRGRFGFRVVRFVGHRVLKAATRSAARRPRSCSGTTR